MATDPALVRKHWNRALFHGEFDDQLDDMLGLLVGRKKYLREAHGDEIRRQVKVGTRVRLSNNLKPKYLNGLTGEIVEFNGVNPVFKVDGGPVGKFKSGRIILRGFSAIAEVLE